jgi:hypothetical protein
MTLVDAKTTTPIPAEQVYEIRTMAEAGQFADALIRLRKIKPLYPRNTFLVALEKQLERLLVLPRDTEPSDVQKKELLGSLPGLVQRAADSLRQQSPAPPQQNPSIAPPVRAERSDRDTARSQLKEQYFQHADEYLKKGAYGSALVEIRRVKIIAPDDPTVNEYERTIRQLVELQQRTGIKTHETEAQPAAESDSPRTGVEASPTPAPPVRDHEPVIVPLTFGEHEEQDGQSPAPLPQSVPQRKSRATPIILTVVVLIGLAIAGMAIFTNPEQGDLTSGQDKTVSQQADQAAKPALTVNNSDEIAASKPADSQEEPNQPEVTTPTTTSETVDSHVEPKLEIPVVVPPVQRKVKDVPPAPPATVIEKSKPAESKNDASPNTAAKPVYTNADPQILHLEQPIFPSEPSGSKTGIEIIIMVQIDSEGKPVKTLVAKSTNPSYNAAIVTAVMKSTYRAGTTPAGPATKWITIPFSIR